MPGVFQDNDIVTNNITTSHLNDNFVSLCIFSVLAESWDSNVGHLKLGI